MAEGAAGSPHDGRCRRAAIDIGSNSIKLLVADFWVGGSEAVWEEVLVTRLGEGLSPGHQALGREPMERTLQALRSLARSAREQGACDLTVIGTSALRRAENQQVFVRRARVEAGVDVDVVSGEREAQLSFAGASEDPCWRGAKLLTVLDVGGGSTEVVSGSRLRPESLEACSVSLGAVSITERYLHADPPLSGELTQARAAIQEEFAAVIPPQPASSTLVGVGGTVTNLASMRIGSRADLKAIHGSAVPTDWLARHIHRMAALPLTELTRLPGLDPRRADIILAGALLVHGVLVRLGAPALEVSTRGLRWGALYEMARRDLRSPTP